MFDSLEMARYIIQFCAERDQRITTAKLMLLLFAMEVNGIRFDEAVTVLEGNVLFPQYKRVYAHYCQFGIGRINKLLTEPFNGFTGGISWAELDIINSVLMRRYDWDTAKLAFSYQNDLRNAKEGKANL